MVMLKVDSQVRSVERQGTSPRQIFFGVANRPREFTEVNLEKQTSDKTMKFDDGGLFANPLQHKKLRSAVQCDVVRHCQPLIQSRWTRNACEEREDVRLAIGDIHTTIEQNMVNMPKETFPKDINAEEWRWGRWIWRKWELTNKKHCFLFVNSLLVNMCSD